MEAETINSVISIGRIADLMLQMSKYTDCLPREEQKPLELFFQAKGLRTKNEMVDDVSLFHV